MVGTVVTLGLVGLMLFYAQRQEASILAQNERTLVKVTQSVTEGLTAMMLAGYADVGQAFSDRLKGIADVADLRILRADGNEAFRDNATIAEVNAHLGDERFAPRRDSEVVPVLGPDDAALRQALSGERVVTYYHEAAGGKRLLTLLAPVVSREECQGCHQDRLPVRGVLKLTTALDEVETAIAETRREMLVLLAVTIVCIMLVIDLAVRKTIVRRLARIIGAMADAAGGDLSSQVPITGTDELGRMADSFNRMIRELLQLYSGLKHEQNKLTTILLGARDGIVVTDSRNRIVLVNPAAERLLGKPAEEIRRDGFLALVGDPDWVKERLAVTVASPRPEAVSYKDRVLSIYIASIRSDGAELIGSAALLRDITSETRLREELERLSITDPLTQLYNRRYFDQKLDAEMRLTRVHDRPLSLVMMDLDHFKGFNDTYGHDMGDRVLQAVAARMRTLRLVDIPCRYGGEEFAVILPDTPADKAAMVAERLRAAIAEVTVDGLAVTVSIGVASRPPFHVDTAEALIKAADGALYAAKKNGRDRVERAVPAGA